MKDCLGNPVGLDDPASLAPLNDFVEGFITCEARAVNVLAAAQTDGSAIVQASCAALHMFAESREGPVNARPFIDAARARAPQASERRIDRRCVFRRRRRLRARRLAGRLRIKPWRRCWPWP